jgi:hypothetical protein
VCVCLCVRVCDIWRAQDWTLPSVFFFDKAANAFSWNWIGAKLAVLDCFQHPEEVCICVWVCVHTHTHTHTQALSAIMGILEMLAGALVDKDPSDISDLAFGQTVGGWRVLQCLEGMEGLDQLANISEKCLLN